MKSQLQETLEDSLPVSYKSYVQSNHIMQQPCSLVFTQFLKIYVIHTNKKTAHAFTAAVFTITKNWKQSRYPSIGECINKLQYIHMRKYYSEIKRNEPASHEKNIDDA